MNSSVSISSAQRELPPLISRDLLFGNPERTLPAFSPDGRRLAWLAPDTHNILQIWVKTVGRDDDRIVTADKKRGIHTYYWAKDNRRLIYLQDGDGDENFHVYGVDLDSGHVRDYTPFQGVRAQTIHLNLDFPNEILIDLNLRDPSVFDVYRLNLTSGALDVDTRNPGDVNAWTADAKFRVRAAQIATADGGTEIRVRADDQSPWVTFLRVGSDEILGAWGFSEDGQSLYLSSSLGRDTAAVVEKKIADGHEIVLAVSDEVDASEVLVHPRRRVVQAVAFSPGRTHWQVVDPTVQADFNGLAKLSEGDFFIADRTEADDLWLVGFHSDRAPIRFYCWDRKSAHGDFLFNSRPQLDGRPLAETKAVVFTARDGLKIHGYLTLPVGLLPRNLPLVLCPHGGPWARDQWGFDPYAQWLANRGYAVLKPNFRGSSGYGKKFLNAGNKQLGLAMHEDLIDAVDWAVKAKYADPQKIGIMGGSYGGYCALAGLAFTPDVFACGVDLCGPSNLETVLRSVPIYWKSWLSILSVRIGDVNDPKDADLLRRASPLNSASRISRALLIGQGANDPRVKPFESEQIIAAIEKNHGHVIYVVYSDEGHGFARPENHTDFNARVEAFLGAYLGGRVEPMAGAKIDGSTAAVRVIGAMS
ncbi:MAG TPA: S9 family peptidase [Candidatus Acidoferrales bacterium]|nr:S9 family peptidase [Candidatus Acidoferrales bacterium]